MKETIKIWAERYAAWTIALGVAIAFWVWGRTFVPATSFKELAQAALNVAAIAVGFLVSSKAILLSVVNTRLVRALRESGHFCQIIGYFVSAIWWSVMMALSSAGLLLFDLEPSKIGVGKQILLTVWVLVLGGTLGANARVIYLFGGLVRGISEPLKSREGSENETG